MNQIANKTHHRASMRETNEGRLRVLAWLAALGIAVWALYGSVIIASRGFLTLSILFALFHGIPLAARGIGWRNRTQPQFVWLRTLAAVPAYPWVVHHVCRKPLSIFALGAGAACVALILVAGFLVERRYLQAGWTVEPR